MPPVIPATTRIRTAARTRFAREIGSTFATTIITVAAGGTQAVLIARHLGPSGKGLIALVLLASGTLSPLLVSGYAASCVYFASRSRPRDAMGNATVVAIIASVGGLAILAILGSTGALDGIAPALNGSYLIVATLFIPLAISQSLFAALLTGMGELPKVNLIRTSQAVSNVLVVLVTLVLLQAGPLAISSGFLAVSASAALWQARALGRLGAPVTLNLHRTLLRDQASYVAKDHAGAVVQYLNYRLDQLFVSGYVGTVGLGLYSVSVTVGELLWILPDAIATAVFPRASRERAGEGRRTSAIAAATSLVFAAMAAIGLALVGRVAIEVLFSSRFSESYDALVWLLPGAVAFGPSKILAADLAGRGHPLVNSACALAGLVVTVTLDIVLIPSRGITGAAMASSASYLTGAALVLIAFAVWPAHATERIHLDSAGG